VARPKSDDRRSAIMAAATRVIARDGLGAATAAIAKEAGVSNGSLFTYFETKADLFNQLYLELKAEAASASMKGLPAKADIRTQMARFWSNSMGWAMAHPDKRHALALLTMSEDITPASKAAGHKAMAGVAAVLERSRAKGPLRNAPMPFVIAMMNAVGDATMDFMLADPAHAKKHSKAGFEALWGMLG
jgi:AcrR family transcriptional regulator